MRQDGSEGRNRRGERAVEQRGIKRENEIQRYINGMTWKHIVVQVEGGNWIQMDGELFEYG